jgi:UDP-glucose 4-epimerase
MKVLVTGGAGFIGSHTCLALAERGYEVVIADSFANSSPKVLPRLAELAGQPFECHQLDIRDAEALTELFSAHRFDAVIHFAALKAVGESCERPLHYFDNNIGGSICLFKAMSAAGVNNLVFSSSATVYGEPDSVPVGEGAALRIANPYGRTKLAVEQMIGDLSQSDPSFHAVNLRYFNPVGAHPSGRIGEDPRGTPNNLMPFVCQVAVGRREKLSVFGSDWPTVDGSGVRDYLHVVDLARAHVSALDFLRDHQRSLTVNLGTGVGFSVLQVVREFERVSGKPVPFEVLGRRAGDVATLFADPSLAYKELGWKAELDLEDMCRDSWSWQSGNPNGYDD